MPRPFRHRAARDRPVTADAFPLASIEGTSAGPVFGSHLTGRIDRSTYSDPHLRGGAGRESQDSLVRASNSTVGPAVAGLFSY